MKRFMIAVLAVAVLFGFAACDNSTPSNTDEITTTDPSLVVSAKAVFNGDVDYLVGEAPKAADFTFTGYDVAGNAIATLDSSLFTVSSPATIAKGDNDVKFAWLKDTVTKIEVTVEDVPGYEIDDIKVAVKDGAQTTYYNATSASSDAKYQKVNKDDFVVTAVYNEGKEKDISDLTGVTLELGTWTNGAYGTAADWDTAPADSNLKYVVKASYSGKDAYTDPVFSFLVNKVSAIRIKVAEGFKLYYAEGGDSTNSSLVNVTDEITMVADYLNGETNVDVTSNSEFANATDGTYGAVTSVTSFPAATKTSATLYGRYKGTDKTDSVTTVNTTLDLVENVKVGISATGTFTITIGEDYNSSSATAPSGLSVKYLLADGTETGTLTINAEKDGYKISSVTGASTFYGNKDELVDVVISATGYESVTLKNIKLAEKSI